MMSRNRTLGVLGGMGPAATADFYGKLVAATPSARDQDHIPIVIVGDPRIPDRSHAIATGAQSEVLTVLLEKLRVLERTGVDAVAIPCNTAHFWLPQLRAASAVPFISLIEASVGAARRRLPSMSTALVLGTRATVSTGIYAAECERMGIRPLYPDAAEQEAISSIIEQVKAGAIVQARTAFMKAASAWAARADAVLLACTELPVAAADLVVAKSTFIDTTAALVQACVAWARVGVADVHREKAP